LEVLNCSGLLAGWMSDYAEAVTADKKQAHADGAGVGAAASPQRVAARGDLWSAVDGLIDRATSLDDLGEHRIEFLAERRWSSTEAAMRAPSGYKTLATVLCLPVPMLLARIGEAWSGPMVILKGPVLADRYPHGVLRPAGDIDLLVSDAQAAHAALCSAGFVATGDPRRYVGIHHLQPLIWPNIPVRVELHHSPKWIYGLEPPPAEELLALAVPARGAAEGFQTVLPEAHAVLLAVHAWAHEPLGNLRDLIDIAALTEDADIRQAERFAQRWGVFDVWRTTYGVVESLFGTGRRPPAMRLWARHLEAVRGRTVAESHLERWLSPFWALPWRTALQQTSRRIAEELRPVPGEAWRTKLSRARLAIRNARVRRSLHERLLQESRLATPPAFLLDRAESRRGDGRATSTRTREGSEEDST
jgi:hypothetical protein